jgi:hypothetical protein
MIIREKLTRALEQKKSLENLLLENQLDISHDKSYIVLVAQTNILKSLIREIEGENKKNNSGRGIFKIRGDE